MTPHNMQHRIVGARIAILDDYQNVALELADWSPVTDRATVTVFNDHLSDAEGIVDRLQEFDFVCVMHERTPLTRDILGRLPHLKLIASTGPRNASIDIEAAAACGIEVMHTNYDSSPTIELTWALILASARNLANEAASVRSGPNGSGFVGQISCARENERPGELYGGTGVVVGMHDFDTACCCRFDID